MGKITKWDEISQNQIFLFFPVSFCWKWHVVPAWTSGPYEHFRPKSRRISEVNLKAGWVSCGRKRWSASPALGPLVIFKRTKLLPAIFLRGLSQEHTFGDSWYRTDRLVCNFYILDFVNFTPKSVPDNCLQTHMSNTWCPKRRNFKHMAEYF